MIKLYYCAISTHNFDVCTMTTVVKVVIMSMMMVMMVVVVTCKGDIDREK